MPWKMHYRFVVEGTGVGSPELFSAGSYGGADVAKEFPNLNAAISSCLAICRRYDALGQDVRGLVYGQPQGADVANPAIPLAGIAGDPRPGVAANVTDEEEYARLDPMSNLLKRRIRDANRSSVTGSDYPEVDIEADVTPAV